MVDEIVLVEITDFNGWAEEYERDVISAGEYRWLDKDIPTFSIRSLLLVNRNKLTDADKKTIENIKTGIATNIEYLKEVGHPKWNTVEIPSNN